MSRGPLASCNSHTGFRPTVWFEQEDVLAAFSCGQDHSLRDAESHLARLEIGNDDHVAILQVLRRIRRPDSGQDLSFVVAHIER